MTLLPKITEAFWHCVRLLSQSSFSRGTPPIINKIFKTNDQMAGVFLYTGGLLHIYILLLFISHYYILLPISYSVYFDCKRF